MPKVKRLKGYMSTKEAADYGHITRQSVYKAIMQGRCKGEKIGDAWYITVEDFDRYRGERNISERFRIDGKLVFDAREGRFSVMQVAKIIGMTLRIPYDVQRVYHFIRKGVLTPKKVGKYLVISKREATKLLEMEKLLAAEAKGEVKHG